MKHIYQGSATYVAMDWLEWDLTRRKRNGHTMSEWAFLDTLPSHEKPEALKSWFYDLNIEMKHDFWKEWMHYSLRNISYTALVHLYNGEREFEIELATGHQKLHGIHFPVTDEYEGMLRFWMMNDYEAYSIIKGQKQGYGSAASTLYNDLSFMRNQFSYTKKPVAHHWYSDSQLAFIQKQLVMPWKYCISVSRFNEIVKDIKENA